MLKEIKFYKIVENKCVTFAIEFFKGSLAGLLFMRNYFQKSYCFLIFSVIVGSVFFSSPLDAYQQRRGHVQVKRSGDIGQFAVPVAAGVAALVRRDFYGMGSYACSFGATLGAAYIIKPIINADRPVKGGMSFPSGHTAAAMAGAAYMQMRYGLVYGIPSYLLASYVGFSRIYAQKHWFRDVLGATAIAMAANAFFTKPFSDKYQLIPVLERDRAGVSVRWEW